MIIAQSDGRIFTGDVDGDGRDEVMIAAFGNATPGQRPDAGGTTPIYIIDFQTLDPPSAEVFTLPNQFITRHSQYAARDITGDGAAELLIFSQNQTGTTLSNEPTGGGTLFVCSPVLGTPTASCGFTASVVIDQGPGRRYPSSIDAANLENDGIPEIVVGYGTACDPDASVTLLEVTSVTPEGPLTLGTPFQRLVVDDLDRDGSPELVVTAGAQRGGDSAAGSLRVFNFNASTRAFELVALTDAVLPSQTCSPPTVLGGTFEPRAFLGLGPRAPANDGCNGVDDDGDGETDENCFLRFLFVPMCYQGTDADFQRDTQAHVDFFKRSLGLDACADDVFVRQIALAEQHIAPDCDPGYFLGNFTIDLRQALTALGIDRDDWTVSVAFTNNQRFPANTTNPAAGLTFSTDDNEMYVKRLQPAIFRNSTQAFHNIIPEVVFSHEFGHLLGLDEEYLNSPQALNPIEARLGCNPDDSSCCEIVNGSCVALKGNRSRFGSGRCPMSAVKPISPRSPQRPSTATGARTVSATSHRSRRCERVSSPRSPARRRSRLTLRSCTCAAE